MGAVQKTISLKSIYGLAIAAPPPYAQEQIATILGILDDKIELNRQTNQTLEAMAQALFKSWFVDFDPVIDNALAAGNDKPEPLKARAAVRQALGNARKPLPEEIGREFPDGFEFRDEMGWVPRGWERRSIKSLSEALSKGTTPSKSILADAEDLTSIKFLKMRDLDEKGTIKTAALELVPRSVHDGALKRSRVFTGDILFSIAGTIGRVAIVPSTLENTNINQAIAFIRLKNKKYSNFLYFYLRSAPVQEVVNGRVVQAVQENFSLAELGSLVQRIDVQSRDDPSAADLQACLAALARIEDEVRGIGVPLGYAHELFALKLHIDLLHQQIERALSAAQFPSDDSAHNLRR